MPTSLTTMRSRRPRPRRGETGLASVELLLVFPALILILLLGLQVAMKSYAAGMAKSAARVGARAAAAEDAGAGSGAAAARQFLASSAGDWLATRAVSASRGADRVSVTVSGTAMTMFPGIDVTVRETYTLPVERITE